MKSSDLDGRETKVREAFGHLPSHPSQNPHADMLDAVQQSMGRRRRKRVVARAAVGTLAATVAIVVVGRLALVNDQHDEQAVDRPESGSVSTLAALSADGLTLTSSSNRRKIDSLKVACEVVEDRQGRPLELIRATGGTASDTASVIFQAEVAKLVPGAHIALPLAETAEVVPADFLLFASMSSGPLPVDASSTSESSSGTVEVISASCGSVPSIELAIDALLGPEEEGQAPVQVVGTLSGS